jgi:N6-adenosine-specific RNA methylase IME4
LGDITDLAESIKKFGLLHSIVVSENKILVAGARRLKACSSLGWDIVPVRFVNLVQIEKGEIEENLKRKDFTLSEMVAVKRALEPEVLIQAEEREKAGIKQPSGNLPQGKTRDIVGSYVGVSGKTLEKGEAVVEAAEKSPEKYGPLLKRVDDGKISVSAAYEKVKRDEPRDIIPLPSGVFDVVYADPPWKYVVNFLSCSPESHYQTMSIEEISNLEVENVKVTDKFADDAILFLWTTNPLLEDALRVMKTWGFTYKSNLVWVKDKIGVGFYFRGQHELLLIGTKGNYHPPIDTNRPSSVLHANVGDHSKKPEELYRLIESMYPDAKYLELFARGNKREKWIAWGNEN